MSKFLFDEFQSISAKEWKQKIQFDLKGADYNKTLLINTNEGITIKPFYHQDKFNQLEIPKSTSKFSICQTIFINDEKIANSLAIDALNRGANTIKFIVNKNFEYDIVLNKIFPSLHKKISIYFQLQSLDRDFIVALMDYVEDENVFINIDLVGNLVKTGNWYFDHKKDFEGLKSILKKAQNTTGILSVGVAHYQNSGANIIQQIAYALSHAKVYLDFLFDLKKSKDFELSQIEIIIKNMQFNFATGSHYFFEIAKLRAFRVLWQLLIEEYGLNCYANIFVEPSLRNKSIYDYNVNMLRTTTECMSAILGGADTISNCAYDAIFHKKNEFGERIARNQL
ncbi:MAG: methylmalonyl-CoA mutase, partial [Flavobacteriaceae bacterium]|nr:methylmalonyl-CoA mutase [Flavobacteriaceae bacterium]